MATLPYVTLKSVQRVTALVVDDDRDTREMYTSFLAAAGVNTVAAEDGVHALSKATTILPDVIATDLRLPRMDGVNFCRSLKRQEVTRRIPVIAFTGVATAGEIAAAQEAGCVSILRKPCHPEMLLGEIQRVLTRSNLAEVAPVASVVPVRLSNRLLAALPASDYQRLSVDLNYRPVSATQVLRAADAKIDEVFFPELGIFSALKTMENGGTIEVAMMGEEGMIGVEAIFAGSAAWAGVVARTAGGVHALTTEAFQREMDRRGPFYDVMNDYGQSFVKLVAQSAACTGLHSAFQRCGRWLLASSFRLRSDEIRLTHEMLAMMLGVRRPTVTLILNLLVKGELIWQTRGKVRIVNRPGLEAAACECYSFEKRAWN